MIHFDASHYSWRASLEVVSNPTRQPDLAQVAPRLWVGAALDRFEEQPARRQADHIHTLGVDVVIDCRLGTDDTDLWAGVWSVEYHRHGIEDSGDEPPTAWFTDGVELIMDRWRILGRGVFVHCEAGVNRSPSLVFAVLLACGLDPLRALQRIATVRPIVSTVT